MSRVADNPVKVVDGVTVDIEGQEVKVDGPKGSLSMTVTVSYTHLTLPTKRIV